jgi:hypothetical protein
MLGHARARRRVRGVDLVFDLIPGIVLVRLVLFTVFLVVLPFRRRVLVDLDARRIFVVAVAVFVVVFGSTRVVVYSDSFPESDCNVSVALDTDTTMALGRDRHTRRRSALGAARRRRSVRLDGAVRKRPSRRSTGHGATMRKMGYD